MIVVYTSPGCASCRKVKQWLNERGLKFIENNIFTTALMRSENGTEDIISKRSKIIQESNIDIEELSLKELVDFIQKNPSILKRPIILNEKSFLVGYDEEEIGAFVPAQLRKIALNACSSDCPNYPECGHMLDAREELKD